MNNVSKAFAPQVKGCKGNPTFKHMGTGLIFSCRKDAIKVMGMHRYRKALSRREFLFHYVCKEGERPVKIIY